MILAPTSINPLQTEPGFAALKDHIIGVTGLAYYENRDNDLAAKIVKRLDCLNLRGCDAYLNRLTQGAAGRTELDHLIKLLTIGETFFFRHGELFDAVRQQVIPAVIERNRESRQLRIWSAGCSTGAEAYSISILLKREFADQLRGWDVSIIGSDINRSFLSRAVKARYEDWALRGMSADLKHTCFSRVGQKWALKDQFKQGVSFQYHNLAEPSSSAVGRNLLSFDVIFCRNVMIYFNEEIIEKIVGHAYQCLIDGGWFLVGHAEHGLDRFREFQIVNCDGTTLYRRSNDPAAISASCGTHDNFASYWPSPSGQPLPMVTDSIDKSSAPETLCGRTRGSSQVSEAPKPRDVRDPTLATGSEFAKVRTLADRGEFETAAAECEQLLRKYPLNAVCHFYRGMVHEQLGQCQPAEQSLRRAIYLDRGFELGHYYLGMTLHRLGQREQAARSLRNALKLLAARDADEPVDDSDELSVAKLTELTLLQLDRVAS